MNRSNGRGGGGGHGAYRRFPTERQMNRKAERKAAGDAIRAEHRRFFYKELNRQTYRPAPIENLLQGFTITAKHVFQREFLPKGNRDLQKAYIKNAKFEFLKKHLADELRIMEVDGEWTYCRRRAFFTSLRKQLALKQIPKEELLPFAKVSKKEVRRLLAQGDPDLDGLYKWSDEEDSDEEPDYETKKVKKEYDSSEESRQESKCLKRKYNIEESERETKNIKREYNSEDSE